jgi:hypothetical protein
MGLVRSFFPIDFEKTKGGTLGAKARLGKRGSGRPPSSHKPIAEDMTSILAGDLYVAGAPHSHGPLVRVYGEGPVRFELGLRAREDRVSCVYMRSAAGDRPFERVDYDVGVSWTECHYGGRRAWLHCAREGCSRRAGRLYLQAPYLICRGCADVRFRTQTLVREDRRHARARALRERLGQLPWDKRRPSRPKGMHWKTYDRLRAELIAIEVELRSEHPREMFIHALEKSLRKNRRL